MAVLNVPTTTYPTIQSAVNAASPGDTVRVAAGSYAESVTIGTGKDRLNIVGAGRGRSILQGATGLIFGFDVTGSGQVSIGGFTVQGFAGTGLIVSTDRNVLHGVSSANNGAAGFSVAGAQNLLIDDEAEGNLTDGFDLGGYGNYLLRCAAERNRVHGVMVAGAANLLFLNCIKDSGADGVNLAAAPLWGAEATDIDGVGGSTLVCNEISFSGASGVDLALSAGNTVFANDCCENGTSGATPVGDGITVSTSGNLVDRNDVECSAASGILVGAAAAGNAIRQNCALGNRPDITVLAAPGANVLDLNTCRISVPPGLCTPPLCI